MVFGARGGIRTPGAHLRTVALYPLSYAGNTTVVNQMLPQGTGKSLSTLQALPILHPLSRATHYRNSSRNVWQQVDKTTAECVYGGLSSGTYVGSVCTVSG